MIVAIDGPAGSGKSTVARAVAERLGFRYLDSGAMYRCVGLAARRRWGSGVAGIGGNGAARAGGDGEAGTGASGEAGTGASGEAGRSFSALDESERRRWEAAVARLADASSIELRQDGAVRLNGEDVTSEIRTSEIAEMASAVAAIGEVRAALVRKQRALVGDGDWVVEGRDIGTVVAPEAEVKVFLTADALERARRRSKELGADERQIMLEQAIRDARDAEREHSPLAAACDAVQIDTTGLSVADVVERIAGLAKGEGRSGGGGVARAARSPARGGVEAVPRVDS